MTITIAATSCSFFFFFFFTKVSDPIFDKNQKGIKINNEDLKTV